MSDNNLSVPSEISLASEHATAVQDPGSVHHPASAATDIGTDRYQLLGEIARGGMGIVFRARDRVLDREVGLKTLLRVPGKGNAIAARFLAEAQITGQLQHPNIPPVHDLGTLPDGRPFIAMKLIKGRTLEAELKDRPDPAHKRGRFLAIFEHIAQGVAYAHDHRVIHRDLKPLNIMIGNFGEVQIMDWGLAKPLADPSAEMQAILDEETDPATAIRTLRGEGDETRPGSVLGTPAYMSREQAIGAINQIDARTDVFSLGGILCTILTGQPPYVGGDAEWRRQLAATAQLDDAFARLDASGAEPDLIGLCKWCLAADRVDRPRNAGEVARAVADLRAEADAARRRAELDRVRAEGERAKAELRTAEQRKRRKVQLALFAAGVLLLFGGVAFVWREDRQAARQKLKEADHSAKEARLQGERDAEARNKANQASDAVAAGLRSAADFRKQYRFADAEAAPSQAAKLAKSGAPERLGAVEQAQHDLAFVMQLDGIRYRKWMWIAELGGKGDFNTKIAAPEYRKAFAGFGLPFDTLEAAEAARRIAASPVKTELVAAMDDWALYETNERLRDRLLEIARKADPGSWTDRLRDPAVRRDAIAVVKLLAATDLATTPPAALSVLAAVMERQHLDPSPLLLAARAQYPTNFELAFTLGRWQSIHGKTTQAIGPFEAASAPSPG